MVHISYFGYNKNSLCPNCKDRHGAFLYSIKILTLLHWEPPALHILLICISWIKPFLSESLKLFLTSYLILQKKSESHSNASVMVRQYSFIKHDNGILFISFLKKGSGNDLNLISYNSINVNKLIVLVNIIF